MKVPLLVTAFLALVSWRLADGDILLAIVFYPVVWLLTAIAAIIVVPEDVGRKMPAVHYLMRIFE